MTAFACIGTWRFGEEFDEFATLPVSFMTEFTMLFGDFPEDWTKTGEMQAFVIVYFLVLFLLVQNFLLAIIVSVPPSCRSAPMLTT